MTGPHLRTVRGLQERAARAVAAAVQEVRDGDWLRHTDSPTTWWAGAALLHGTGELGPRLAGAEAFYSAYGVPVRVQVCPACPPGLDEALADRGYARSGDVRLLAAGAGSVAAQPALPVLIEDRPGHAWARLLADAQGGAEAGAQLRLVERVASPSAYATASLAGRPVAVGRAVQDDGWTGVFGMATLPAARRRGAASAVLAGLARWSLDAGSDRLYLQVTAGSPAALALYRDAGFRPLASYHYRTAPTA